MANCDILYECLKAPTAQTIDEGDTLTMTATASLTANAFVFCDPEFGNLIDHTAQVNEGSGYVTMSSSTKIKTDDTNPGTNKVPCGFPYNQTCASCSSPTHSITIEANTGSCGAGYPIRWKGVDQRSNVKYSSAVTITVSDCPTGGTPQRTLLGAGL